MMEYYVCTSIRLTVLVHYSNVLVLSTVLYYSDGRENLLDEITRVNIRVRIFRWCEIAMRIESTSINTPGSASALSEMALSCSRSGDFSTRSERSDISERSRCTSDLSLSLPARGAHKRQ